MEKATKGLEDHTLEKINTSIANKKPAYLAVLILGTNRPQAVAVAAHYGLIDFC